MNLSPVDQTLQLVAWSLALIEFIAALYALLLNARHAASRHLSALLLLFTLNNFALGLMIGATDATRAAWPALLLAATTPAISLGLLLVVIVLLKPQWRHGRRRWIGWLVYGLASLPILLTVLDAGLGTRLWYTGLAAEAFANRFVLSAYTAGSFSLPLTVLSTYVAPAAAVALSLYVALRGKRETPLNRRLAWLLVVGQVVAVIVRFTLPQFLGPLVTTLITVAVLVLVFTYAALRQTVSERRLRRGRLQPHLLAVILAIALPILVAAITFVSTRAGSIIEQNAFEQLRLTHNALESRTSVWLEMNVSALQQLVSLPDIISMDAAQQKPVLEAMAGAYPLMYLVSTTDLNGLNVARSDAADPKDYSDRYWFLNARDNATLTFQTLIGRTSGQPALVVSLPIRDASGDIVGVGMFASELTDITAEVQASRIGETGFAYIVDAGNQVVAHPDPAYSAELRDLSAYAPVAALRQGTRGLMSFTDEEGRRWRAHVGELDNGWGIIVQQEEAELLSTMHLLQRISWAVLIAGVLLLSTMALLAMNQAFRPIGTLTETVTAIAAGDLTRIAPVESEDELGILARSFNSMTEQLRGLIGSLEQQVTERTNDLARRTNQLEAAAQVAREAAAIRDIDQLLDTAVRLISDRFGFYHAGIFLLDEARQAAVLRAASSPGGQRMLARGHRLEVGKVGIVGYVAASGEPRIALDVGTDAVFFDNPDLPQTRSEMALPLKARGRVIGVLDVQSIVESAFTEEDVATLAVMAGQLAIAIENAQLFQQSDEQLRELSAVYRRYGEESWQRIGQLGLQGYRYDGAAVLPVTDAAAPGEVTTESEPAVRDEGDRATLIIPIRVREAVIATLRVRRPQATESWSDEEVTFIQTLAAELGSALESARLFGDAQRMAARERLTRQVTDTIRASITIQDAIERTMQEMGRLLGASEIVTRLGTEEDLLARSEGK